MDALHICLVCDTEYDIRPCPKCFPETHAARARSAGADSSGARGSAAWVPTRQAAIARMMSKTTFRRRAMALGVGYRMGNRIWDGYEWNAADLERLMPPNVAHQPPHELERTHDGTKNQA